MTKESNSRRLKLLRNFWKENYDQNELSQRHPRLFCRCPHLSLGHQKGQDKQGTPQRPQSAPISTVLLRCLTNLLPHLGAPGVTGTGTSAQSLGSFTNAWQKHRAVTPASVCSPSVSEDLPEDMANEPLLGPRGFVTGVSRCVAERKYTQEQARKEFQQVFIPECNDDGTYSQVQCHSYTGYCWCVTPNGRPISGTAVAHKTPRCPGSVNDKLPPREGTGRADDAVAPAIETQPQGDEEDIASRYPTLWTEQVKSRQNKTNKHSVSSCDQEHQSALEEAKQPKNDNVVIPECAHGGLYKPVQCHPSTGYCWCVLVDTGRPIPGTSTRYEQPKCDNTARAHPAKTRDLYKGRQLHGCPGPKKHEFLTSVLDALSTDMVHAVSDPSSSSGRLAEPDPSHTLEERVVHWYFKLLDKNSSGDIGKKEVKPFKRLLRKKSKPKKCVKKFVEYCDANSDTSLSVQELMGCLGVTKEEGKAGPRKRHTPRGSAEGTSNRQPRKQG